MPWVTAVAEHVPFRQGKGGVVHTYSMVDFVWAYVKRIRYGPWWITLHEPTGRQTRCRLRYRGRNDKGCDVWLAVPPKGYQPEEGGVTATIKRMGPHTSVMIPVF